MKQAVRVFCRWAPVVMSLAAMALLATAFFTGWERGLKDEGVAAHLWQLLIGLQLPIIFVFLVTADGGRHWAVARAFLLQLVVLGLAMAPVAILRM